MATAVADLITRRVSDVLRERGTCLLALSGGSTPARAYRLLAGAGVDWDAVHVVQTDERVTDDRPATSAAVIEDNLITPAGVSPSRWHPMPTAAHDLLGAVDRYAALLAGLTPGGVPDIALLGLGEDGHTASLFAGDPAVDDPAPVVVTQPYQGTVRVSMAVHLLASVPTRVVLAAGAAKARAVARLRGGEVPDTDPAARVLGVDGELFADQAAAGEERAG
ncbi:6-phosphogluconolactonase [Actinosynnema sp. NPDC047251]|nr:6-phosphogluconolactonase [Saccharothrix espanaensis]